MSTPFMSIFPAILLPARSFRRTESVPWQSVTPYLLALVRVRVIDIQH